MGTAVSKQELESTTKLINNIMNKSILDIRSNSHTHVSSDQYINANLRNANIRCPLKFKQSSVTVVDAILSNTNDLVNQLSNDLITELTDKIKNDIEHKLDGLNLGSVSVNNAKAKAETVLKKRLKNIVETTVTNTVKQSVDNRQALILNLSGANISCPRGKDVYEFDQNMTIDIISKNIAVNILDNVVDNVVDTELKKDLTNKGVTKIEGLNMTYAAAFIAIIIIVVFVGYYLQPTEDKKVIQETVSDLTKQSMGNKVSMGNIKKEIKLAKRAKEAKETEGYFHGGYEGDEEDDDMPYVYTGLLVFLSGALLAASISYKRDIKKICDKYGLDDETCEKNSIIKYIPF